ncbi:MAG: hypothetical protein R2711_19260 [Acidimicrobiales bacterium]
MRRRRVRGAGPAIAAALALALIAGGCASGDGDQVRTAGGDASTSVSTSDSSLDELLVSCGGTAYPRQALDSPTGAEADDDPAAAGLRALIADPDGIGPIPETGWRRLYDEGGKAVFGNGTFGDDYHEVELEERDGRYEFDGSSMGCSAASVDVPGRSLASFGLPDGELPDPTATTFTVLVTEHSCTGGEAPGDRLGEPQIQYGADAVGLLFTADPLPDGSYTCPGNPPQEVTVELSEPLGDRRIEDLSSYPPGDPTATDP